MIIEDNSYPRWMYSPTEEPRIFTSEVELELAEGQWYDSPAAIPKQPTKKTKKADTQ